ncbi:MAG: hypothetical protein EHM58_04480 [Ignavibacteriae bacterium]|nr:MAG: hypothetical protein EHM58_04480 [Ignavibacteriota bacterium]
MLLLGKYLIGEAEKAIAEQNPGVLNPENENPTEIDNMDSNFFEDNWYYFLGIGAALVLVTLISKKK